MKIHILSAGLSLLLLSSAVMAQSAQDDVFRMNLSAPIFFGAQPPEQEQTLAPALPLHATAGETAYDGRVAGTTSVTVEGELPPGLVVSGNAVSGTFTTPGEHGPFWLRTDGGMRMGPYSIVVEAPLHQDDLQSTWSVAAGSSVKLPIPQTSGGAGPYEYDFAAPTEFQGAVRVDRSLREIGIDVPAQPGDHGRFVLTATDARGRTASTSTTVIGVSALALTGVEPTYSAMTTSPFRIEAVLSGGNESTYSTTLLSGTLPPGISITNPAQGIISGVPTTEGAYSFVLRFSDGATAIDREISVEVSKALVPTFVAASTTYTTISNTSLGIPAFPEAQVGDLVIVLVQSQSTWTAPTSSGTPLHTSGVNGYTISYTRVTRPDQTFWGTPNVSFGWVQAYLFRNAGDPVLLSAGGVAVGSTPADIQVPSGESRAGLYGVFMGRQSDRTGDLNGAQSAFADPSGNFQAGIQVVADSGRRHNNPTSSIGRSVVYGVRPQAGPITGPLMNVTSNVGVGTSYATTLLLPYRP